MHNCFMYSRHTSLPWMKENLFRCTQSLIFEKRPCCPIFHQICLQDAWKLYIEDSGRFCIYFLIWYRKVSPSFGKLTVREWLQEPCWATSLFEYVLTFKQRLNATPKPQWNKSTSQMRQDYPSRSYGNNSWLHGMETTEVKIIRTSEKRKFGREIGLGDWKWCIFLHWEDKKVQQKWMIFWLGKTTMAELAVCLVEWFDRITVVIEKSGEVPFFRGEDLGSFPSKNGKKPRSWICWWISWIWWIKTMARCVRGHGRQNLIRINLMHDFGWSTEWCHDKEEENQSTWQKMDTLNFLYVTYCNVT